MFDTIFGWRKASKCKKLIKRVQCRLKLLKNKRHSIVKQLREDVAQLIRLGYQETAFNRAEQLFKDENIMVVYDLLDHFCEFINIQLSYIRRNRDCPNDINEAVSSLIFASARCADLPELPAIRKLFGERYGQRFATAAVELLPGNLVNREIKEKLSIKSVSDDAKYRLIDEIARDFCLQAGILALKYIPEMQQQVKEITGHQKQNRNNSKTEGSAKMQTSDANEIEGKSIQLDPLEMSAYAYPNSEAICTSLSSSQGPSPDKMEMESPGDGKSQNLSRIFSSTSKNEDQRIKAPSSSESLPSFAEEVVVYLDDIEELQSSMGKGDYQDQRLFKFKSPILPKRGAVADGNGGSHEGYMENSSSRTFSKSRNSHETTRSRQRSLSLESSNMKDTDHQIYYESYQYRKLHKKKTTVAEKKESSYVLKSQKQLCCIQPHNFKYNTTSSCCNCHFNSEPKTCSLENPCYICTGDDSEVQFPPRNPKKRLTHSGQFPIFDAEENLDDKFCHRHCSSNGAANDESGCIKANPTQNPRRSDENGTTDYGVFNLPKLQQEKIVEKVTRSDSAGSHVSCNSSSPSVASSQTQTRKGRVPPYLRAMTMPKESPREIQRYSIQRSNSLPFENPNHVHPKLPEYDDLAAKFIALKKEHLLHKQ